MRRLDPLPEKRKPALPPALIFAGSGGVEAWTEAGVEIAHGPDEARRLLAGLKGCQVFSASKLNVVARAVDARHITGTIWRKHLIGLKVDGGPKVVGTRGILGTVRDKADAFADLLVAESFCRAHRVHLGSPGWTSEQFLRSTLRTSLRLGSPTGKRGVMGGRKDCPDAKPSEPMIRGEGFYVDLHAAYPAAMVASPLPLRLVPASSRGIDAPVGIARARVTIPESMERWPPIPGLMPAGLWWQTGEIEGWWPLCELRLARTMGCPVEIDAVYEGRGYDQPFGPWMALMVEGRQLPGAAGRWMKAISNALWGSFSMEGEVWEVRFADQYGTRIGEIVRRRGSPPPDGGFLAGEVSARVRVRLFDELILPFDPWYVDTDGGVIRAGAGLPEPLGANAGEWSVRHWMKRFEARGAQAYRWTDHQDVTRAVIAGVPDATAADFDRYAPEGIQAWRVKRWEPGLLDEHGDPVPVFRRSSYAALPEGWTVRDPDAPLVASCSVTG